MRKRIAIAAAIAVAFAITAAWAENKITFCFSDDLPYTVKPPRPECDVNGRKFNLGEKLKHEGYEYICLCQSDPKTGDNIDLNCGWLKLIDGVPAKC